MLHHITLGQFWKAIAYISQALTLTEQRYICTNQVCGIAFQDGDRPQIASSPTQHQEI